MDIEEAQTGIASKEEQDPLVAVEDLVASVVVGLEVVAQEAAGKN